MTKPGLIVLGACGGIGQALVRSALDAGYTVAALDLPQSIERSPPPPDVTAVAVDATDEQSLAGAARQTKNALRSINGFVNLCGFATPSASIVNTSPETWREVIDGNITAAYLSAHAIAPLIEAGGAIVNVGSSLGVVARPGYGPYAISKAGIFMLTKQLAIELAPDIRVNCVAPNAVDTPFLRGGTGRVTDNDTPRLDTERYIANIPLGRMANADDVAGPILFLLSAQAKFITGQTIYVNGGAYMP